MSFLPSRSEPFAPRLEREEEELTLLTDDGRQATGEEEMLSPLSQSTSSNSNPTVSPLPAVSSFSQRRGGPSSSKAPQSNNNTTNNTSPPTTSTPLSTPASSSSNASPTHPQPGASRSPAPPPLVTRGSILHKQPPDGAPKTPRTANRVRFDLESEPSSSGLGGEERGGEDHHHHAVANGHGPKRSRFGRRPEQETGGYKTLNGIRRLLQFSRLWGGSGGAAASGSGRRGGDGYLPVEEDEREEEGEEEGAEMTVLRGSRGDGEGEEEPARERLLEGIEAPSVSLALEEERVGKKSGMRAAFMNMANSIIGAGIIGQPYAFRQAGLLAGTLLLVGLTFTVDWTINLIVINSKLSGADSFQATMQHCFGQKGLIAISLAQWAFAFGGMLAFCVIVGDTIPHVMVAIWPSLPTTDFLWLLADRRVVVLILVLGVSYPLSLYRDIAKLSKASTLALLSMLIILVAVITQGARVSPDLRGSLGGDLLLIRPGIFQAIGVISFAFVCHHNSLLIYGSLQKPTLDRFARVTHYSTAVSMAACLTMALAGFLTFGDRTAGNVLNNFPSDNLLINIARFCFGLNMLTTLPLEAFVCREVMLNYFHPCASYSTPRHFLYTTGLVFSAVLLSLLTCDLGAVFELIGATSASALAYIFPPLCYLRLTSSSDASDDSKAGRGFALNWKRVAAWACVAFGVLVLCVSSGLAIVKMIKGGGEAAGTCT